MKVIKHIKSTDEFIEEDYPAIWPNPLYRLDKDLEYFEIQELTKPSEYNSNWHNLGKIYSPINNKGKSLPICLIEWQLIEKPKNEILSNFNSAFGTFIDVAYPLWKRVKDFSQATDEGTIRQAQEASLRELREQRESDFLNSNVLPDFEFKWL